MVNGLTIATYSRPRVYLGRDAWEMLPEDGVPLMRVRPTDGDRFALAFTARELEQTFGEVRETQSWEEARCYHFPTDPPAVRAFLVRSARSRVKPSYSTLSTMAITSAWAEAGRLRSSR
ncbi:MAG: hypothetical protein ACP5H2_10235 [Solirubrobacteraceae bacterium]